MFWGMEVTSMTPVAMTTNRPLRISKAVLVAPAEDHRSFSVELQLKVESEGKPLVVCKFPPRSPESPLDLHFAKGERVMLSVSPGGHVVVHLTGYYTDEEEMARAHRIARADCRMDQLLDICNRILERTYHIN